MQVNVNDYATHRISRCVALTVVLGLSALAQPLRGQKPANWFFASVGAGVGKSGPSSSLGVDQYSGPSGQASLGVTLTSRGVISLDVTGWRDNTPIGSSKSAFGTLSLRGYPFAVPLSSLFFQGGLGVGHGSFPTRTTAGTVMRLSVTHPALLIGVGYDVPLACPLWITPFFQSFGTFGGHRITQVPTPGEHESANAILFHLGVALKYSHPGVAGHCRERTPVGQ